jgi:hypothetical protein
VWKVYPVEGYDMLAKGALIYPSLGVRAPVSVDTLLGEHRGGSITGDLEGFFILVYTSAFLLFGP